LRRFAAELAEQARHLRETLAIDRGDRVGGAAVGARDAPDRNFDRKTARVWPARIEIDQMIEQGTRVGVVYGLKPDRAHAALGPADEHRGDQRVAIGKVPIETAFGDTELLRDRFHADTVPAVRRKFSERRGHPGAAVEAAGRFFRGAGGLTHELVP
jgi:hypothetical protein